MYLIKCFIKVAVLGKYLLFNLERKFQKLFTDKSTSFNSKFVLKTPAIVKSFFTLKDKFPKMLLSGLVKCGGCNITNYDEKKRYFKVRICEYLGILHLTEKKVKIDNNKVTANQEHHLYCNYFPSFECFSILIRGSNHFQVNIMGSLLIARDKPVLNKADSWLLLELFWYFISGYRMMFYHIIWCPSIPLGINNCRLFSFKCFIASFSIL